MKTLIVWAHALAALAVVMLAGSLRLIVDFMTFKLARIAAAALAAATLAGCASQSASVTTAAGDTMTVNTWTLGKDLQSPAGEFDTGAVRLSLHAGSSTSMTPEQAAGALKLLGLLAGVAVP